MIARIKDGVIVSLPQNIPTSWRNPDTGISYTGFINMAWSDIQSLGWREVVDTPVSCDQIYEQISIGDWYYDINLDIVTRDYTVSDKDLETVRTERLAAVRRSCNTGILAVIDIYQQMNLANGIISDLGYTDWIADMISESNRCEDLYIAAVNMNDLKAVVWNFPAYIYP